MNPTGRIGRALTRRNASSIGGPTHSMYHVGEIVTITKPLRYVGVQGRLLELYYLPSSYRKGYYDYAAQIEITEGPATGKVVSILQGNFKKEGTVTEEQLKEQAKKLQEQTQQSRERRKRREAEKLAEKAAGGWLYIKKLPDETWETFQARELEVLRQVAAGDRKAVEDLERKGVIDIHRALRPYYQDAFHSTTKEV